MPSAGAGYVVSFPEQAVSIPPTGGVVDRVLTQPVFTETPEFVLRALGNEVADGPVVLFVPNQPSGYWTVTGLLAADGTAIPDVVTVPVAGGVRIEIASPPSAGESRTFRLVLRYDPDMWDHNLVEKPGGTLATSARPFSTVTIQVISEALDGREPANYRVSSDTSFDIPGYGFAVAMP